MLYSANLTIALHLESGTIATYIVTSMAEFKLVSTTVVVLADSNNPRLLNPDFLERNKIVPEKWTPANVLVTPPFATVQYAEGITITVEEAKLNFAVDTAKVAAWSELLPRVAIRYMEILPHVTYKAVGLNFNLQSDDPSGEAAESILMSKMLTSGPWLGFCGGMTGVNLEFQYRKAQPLFSLKIGVRETIEGDKKTLLGYIVAANYHHDFSQAQSNERAEYIRQLSRKHDELRELLRQLPLSAT